MAQRSQDQHRLGPSLTCHAWNGDGTQVAFCPNNEDIQIKAFENNQFKDLHVLTQHDSVVTGIDWAPKSNRLVTCSQDRNAYVWVPDVGGVWKPNLVILRINRAATNVHWSPNEDKFAVASGAKVVSVCHYEEDNEWWVSKHIKGHKSTVTKVSWHPNNMLLATASTDFKARVFTAHIKGVDRRPGETPFGPIARVPFGKCLWEGDCNGWVHSVVWSPSGNSLCFVGHDSSITFVDASRGEPVAIQTIKMSTLPLVDILFVREDAVVGVGHDCNPLLFAVEGGSWKFSRKLDERKQVAGSPGSVRSDAFKMFQDKVDKGTTDAGVLETKLDTKHQNTITCIRPHKCGGPVINQFSTSGLDGAMVFWKM